MAASAMAPWRHGASRQGHPLDRRANPAL